MFSLRCFSGGGAIVTCEMMQGDRLFYLPYQVLYNHVKFRYSLLDLELDLLRPSRNPWEQF